jgi:proton-dependent oligopeptide transporter, POT family
MTATAATPAPNAPDFPQTLGHPRPLWMLFMTEFWERCAVLRRRSGGPGLR